MWISAMPSTNEFFQGLYFRSLAVLGEDGSNKVALVHLRSAEIDAFPDTTDGCTSRGRRAFRHAIHFHDVPGSVYFTTCTSHLSDSLQTYITPPHTTHHLVTICRAATISRSQVTSAAHTRGTQHMGKQQKRYRKITKLIFTYLYSYRSE